MEPKQVIIIRKDCNMRKGKMIAQGAHASMKIFFDRMLKNKEINDVHKYSLYLTEEMNKWKEGSFKKICLYVNSEDELMDIYAKASKANLPVALIIDSGLTEFKGNPTRTCLAIGPDDSDLIDSITGHLQLL